MSSTSEKEPNISPNIESINEIERNANDVRTDNEPNVTMEIKDTTIESTATAQNDESDKSQSSTQMQQRSSNLVSSNLAKLTSKPVVLSKQINAVSTNSSKANSNNLTGQIVFIQSPGGTKQPIRITSASSSSGLPIIKTSNSNALQKLQDKKFELTQTINTKSSETKQIGNASALLQHDKNNRHIVLESAPLAIKATPVPLITSTNNMLNKNIVSTSVTNTMSKRTITVSQAQQMGIISSEKLKELVSAAANKNQSINTSANKMVNPQQKMIILNKTKQQQLGLSNYILQTPDNKGLGSEQKSTTISQQNLIKIAQGGQIRTVNVAGKGVQYVRVLNSSSENRSSTAVTTTASTTTASTTTAAGGIGNSIYTKPVIPNKFSTNDGQHKLILKGGEKFTFLKTINSTSIKPVYTIGSVNQHGKQIMQSTSTPKKKLSITTIPPKSVTEKQQIVENNRANDMIILNSHLKDRRIALVTQKSDDEGEIDNNSSFTSNKVGLFPRKYQLFGGIQKEITENAQSQLVTPTPDESVDDALRRKHCNCTKSQCLKLYCDCFANGEFCSNCNCKECFNNLENEGERQKAIRMCLERNPHAFKPKIGKIRDKNDALRRHTKGCNCKRSGCLKNYCECYEAKIICSENCKCHGCRNTDESFDHKSIDSSIIKNNSDEYNDSNVNNIMHGDRSKQIKMDATEQSQSKQKGIKRSLAGNVGAHPPSPIPAKKTCNFMTQDVIEATVQCIIAQADECLRNNYDIKTSERMLIEEFGRCLVEIIDYSMKSNDG